jgi:prepilin-type N-terminal cleavage/methylation domain-containing protein
MPFVKKNKSSRGFTLIELLVVIAIIGVLASIVLVAMTGVRAQARDTVRKADMRQLITAQELYYGDNNNAYFQNAAGACTITGTGCYPGSIGTYLSKTPDDPSNSGDLVYKGVDNSGDNQKFCYYAKLEGGGYYVASHVGSFEKASEPSGVDAAAALASCENPN